MAERTFNFHGANVTFNDIHDLTGCTIYTGRAEDISQQVEEETTKDGGNSFDHESSPICTNEAAGGIDKSTESTRRKAANNTGKEPCSEEPIFRYISPFVTDKQERQRIHAVVKNIVSGAFPMAYICGQLKQLVKEQKIALNVSFEDQHNELVRLGLPADRKGFSLQNYKNYI